MKSAGGPLRRSSLTFRSKEQEQAFLQRSADRLLSRAIVVCSAVVCGLTLFFSAVAVQAYMQDFELDPADRLGHGAQAVTWLLFLVMLVVAKSPSLHRRVGLAQREYALAGVFVALVVLAILSNEWYLAQLLGSEARVDTCRDRRFSEAALVLTLSVVLTATHFTLPLRWVAAFVVEVAVVGSYTAVALTLKSCEKHAAVTVLHLAILTLLTACGKRQLERAERQLFLQVCEDDHEKFDSVARKGRREQWLLAATELTVDGDASILGKGGFGIVASGRWQSMPVALKFVKDHSAGQSLVNLSNELHLLRQLFHPNIVLLHGACMDMQTGDIVLVLERVWGMSLDAWVSRQHANPNKLVRAVVDRYEVMLGACRALVYLHSRQPSVVHGDLKGENILVERRSTGSHARLLDFGLARALSPQAKPLGGTIRWSAPEVLTRGAPSAAADVFSFGRVIYYIVVGAKPLADFDHKAIHQAFCNEEVLPLNWPRDAAVEVECCRPLAEAATTFQPDCRPSADLVCRDLEAALRSTVAALAEATGLEGPHGTGTILLARPGFSDANFWEKVRHLRQVVTSKKQRPEAAVRIATSRKLESL